MSNKDELTYMFKNKKTNEVMCFLPLFSLIKFISSHELGFASYHASGNTCQMIKMLQAVLDNNKYLTQFSPNVLGLDIPGIHRILSQNAGTGQRDGWQRFTGTNPKLAAELFNTDNKKQNLNVDISCAGKDDDDMVGVVFDDFLSAYFDKAKTASTLLSSEHNKEILYYRNLNITGTSKLVTGLSNFNTQVFRRELLKHNMFLGNDMNVYTIGAANMQQRFQFAQDSIFSLWTQQIIRCLKIITENVWVDENNAQHDLYDPQEASDCAEKAKNHLLNCFSLMNCSCSSSFYDNENRPIFRYDYESKRFVIKDRSGVERDATGWLYEHFCDAVTKNQEIAATKKPLKTFLDELDAICQDELNVDMAHRQEPNYVPVHDSLYRSVMSPTIKGHNDEKLNLVNNIVNYFTKDLTTDKLKEIQITKEEKENMKECLFEKTPVEYFFRDALTINSVINTDKRNLERGSDSEKNVTEYILSKGIENILTDQGLEFLNMIKEELKSDERITEDNYFNEYKLQNDKIYKNTPNRKTKIEFSVLKALIECINDGPEAPSCFYKHLSHYLNYFFCNKDSIGKKELRKQIDKTYDDIRAQLKVVNQKMAEYEKERNKDVPREEIEKKYGKMKQLKSEHQQLTTQKENLKKMTLSGDELKTTLEADYNFQYRNDVPIPWKERKIIKLEKFGRYFLGYDENLFDGVRQKISDFVDKNDLLEDTVLKDISDRQEKISCKTDLLIAEMRQKIGNLKFKINIEWVELCIKYVLIRDKMKKQSLSDGVVTQDNIEKDPDAYLNFVILDLYFNFREILNEFDGDRRGVEKSNAYKKNKVMHWFNFLQNFINAGYFLTYGCTPDEMCEYIYHVRDIEFFMNHNPEKLETLFASEGGNPADALINFLFKNISFGDEEKKKQVIRVLKMMVCQFSVVLSSTDHMTQINMMKFGLQDRKFTNGVLYGINGLSDCFMVPIQEAYNKAKAIDPSLFNQGIEEILPKLQEGMKWADINKKCDLFLNSDEWEMLSVDQVEKMFADDEKLAHAAVVQDYCFEFLAKRKPREFDEFLMSINTDSNKNVFEGIYRKRMDFIDRVYGALHNNFYYAYNEVLKAMHVINGLVSENNKKIGLSLVDTLISNFESNLRKYTENAEHDVRVAILTNAFVHRKDEYKIIETITSLIGHIYFKWNNVADESERAHCKNILNSVLGTLEIALEVMNPEAIFGNNKDLILWLYLMYKKAECDHVSVNQNNALDLDNEKYFLKDYKVGDGAEKIFKKNVFYMNDDRQGFGSFIIDKWCPRLAEHIITNCNSYIPWNDQVLTLQKYQELSNKSNENKTKLKSLFEKKIEKDDLKEIVNKQIYDDNKKSIIEMSKSIIDPEKILKTWNQSSNPKHLFLAFKALYRGEVANKSQDECNQELQKLLLSDESENIIKRLFKDSFIRNNRSFNKAYDDQINMSINSIEILSDLVLDKNMKISLTTAIDLVDAVQSFVVHSCDEEINQQPFIYNEKYKNFFRGANNIFDFVVKIIGQIPVSSISGTSDAEEKLKILSKLLNIIFNSEVIGRKADEEEMCQRHKSLRLWMYLLYKRLIYNKDQNNDHSEDILLKDCKIEATPAEMKKQGIVLDSDCMDKFEKLINPCNLKKYSKFVDIRRCLCEDALVDLMNDQQDWRAFDELFVQFPDKTGNLLLSDEKDGVISKLFLSSDELFKPIEPTEIEVYGKKDKTVTYEQLQAGTQKNILWAKRFSDIYNNIIKGKEKLSFRVVLSYIKFVHNISRWLREFNLVCKGKVLADLCPEPLDAILDAIGKISFKKGNIQDVATKEEYDELLKTIQDEVNYYNTDNRNIAADKKSDLLWYLSLLDEKINNGNDCSTGNDNIIEFKKSDGDYSIRDYKLSKILNENGKEVITQNPKVLKTVIARLKDKKFLPVEDESALSSWKKDCILDLEKTKLDKMTGILNNAFKKQYKPEKEMFLKQIKNRARKIKISNKLKGRILTVDRKKIEKKIERVFKPWREKAIKEKKLTRFNDLLAEKRENALSDAFTEIKSKFDESKKLDGAQKLYNIAKKLNDKKIVNLPKKTLSTWNNNAHNIKKNEKMDILNNATVNLDKGVKGKLKGVKKEFLDALKNNANKANNVEKVAIDNISSNDANKISNPNNNKQAMLDMYFGRIIKSIIAIILDCVLAALAVIFLKEIALIAAIIATALVFVGFGVYLIQNIRCYQCAKSQIETKSEITDDVNKLGYKQEVNESKFDLSKYKPPVNDVQSVEENNKSNNIDENIDI